MYLLSCDDIVYSINDQTEPGLTKYLDDVYDITISVRKTPFLVANKSIWKNVIRKRITNKDTIFSVDEKVKNGYCVHIQRIKKEITLNDFY